MTEYDPFTVLSDVLVRVWHDRHGEPYVIEIRGEKLVMYQHLTNDLDRTMVKKQMIKQSQEELATR